MSFRHFVLRLVNVARPGRAEAALTRETDAHLALLEDDYLRRGLSVENARLAARRAFGGVEQMKDLAGCHRLCDRPGARCRREGNSRT